MNEREIVCEDFGLALDQLRAEGYRIDLIYPADEPHTALLSREGSAVRVSTRADAPQPTSGLPPFKPEFIVTRADASAGEGRAGMLYRDLIPGRLGGRYIASHISIPQGGPVADWVHYHRIALQVISVRRGWVRVVYEDQSDPFVMNEGDLVLQPPEIRHRVLESSAGFEVVEISAPALHATFADHDMALPNRRGDPARLFGRQRFLHHVAAEMPWTDFHGARARDTAIHDASAGIADIREIRMAAGQRIDVPAHDGELVFGFLLDGSGRLDFRAGFNVGPADSFVIPPGERWSLGSGADGLKLLHVTTARMG